MTRLVHGFGFNDKKYKTRLPSGKNTVAYSLWSNMVSRCYSPVMLNTYPTYRDCEISEDFRNFSYFHDWLYQQDIHKIDSPNVDKDIVRKGNKIYSPSDCIVLPVELNNLMISRKADRGELPLGVSWRKRELRFIAQCNIGGKRKTLGYFDCKIEAFECYKYHKEAEIHRLASIWSDRIHARAYEALINYKIEITD